MGTITKGPLLEEQLRAFFLRAGYFVLRGVKVLHNGAEVTDIDLVLYSRASPFKGLRTNVDVKNKRTPKALERIFWAKGLQQVLGYDNCIVVTTDYRKDVVDYGKIHDVTVFDGRFVSQLSDQFKVVRSGAEPRLTEEALYKLFDISGDVVENPWTNGLESAKNKLSGKITFNVCNALLVDVQYFAEQFLAHKSHEEALTRAFYLTVSYFLLAVDWLGKDISMLTFSERKDIYLRGFRYGSTYENFIKHLSSVTASLKNGEATLREIQALMEKAGEEHKFEVLSEYCASARFLSRAFGWSLKFEALAYAATFTSMADLDVDLKSTIALLVDFFGIPRESVI